MADILVNKSNRAVMIDGVLFIPNKHIPGMDAEALKAKFPRVREMMDKGEIVVITPAQAAKLALEDKPMDELKEIAKKNDIDISHLEEKEDVVAVIKAEKKSKKK